MTPRLGERGWLFIFNYSNLFYIFLIKLNYAFSIYYIVLTCYVFNYCIWLNFDMCFSCFLAGFLLFFPRGSVTECDSLLERICYLKVYFISYSCILFWLLLLWLGSNRCTATLVVINICTSILKMCATE